MNNCPCCSAQLLRHARNNKVYWFCSRCRQEMPSLVAVNTDFYKEFQMIQIRKNIFAEPISLTAKSMTSDRCPTG